jgi:hypothetical protein
MLLLTANKPWRDKPSKDYKRKKLDIICHQEISFSISVHQMEPSVPGFWITVQRMKDSTIYADADLA